MTTAYEGNLFGWFETGLEGFVWALDRDNFEGYDALVILEAGDKLTIFNKDGEPVYTGVIEPDCDIGLKERPTGHKQPSALGCWIHWTQKGFAADDWANFFISEKFRGRIERA
ncbi:MAG: hypothetical protein GYB33_09575 [Gammaproteobacteria bacterium]|uniref:hypothetical protein n=1 Tax=Pseudomaricurvus alcaniphilus TaxID=1166482 RepID=UPI0014091067|nr:hypothetical protein [Pseudomaricurvus alcaniphilus]MBR9910586.1 hypothetical protein [Gammaproteobacteria bacterium]NHN39615.1 hypothetical protein [Pseudomaricurvus alcaniphilus]